MNKIKILLKSVYSFLSYPVGGQPTRRKVSQCKLALDETRAAIAAVLNTAIGIMDDHNPEGNSTMLWDDEWQQLRTILVELRGVIEDHP